MKKSKSPHENHTSSSKIGMGDSYGTGIKAKVGKVRDVMGLKAMTNKKLGVPPKKLA